MMQRYGGYFGKVLKRVLQWFDFRFQNVDFRLSFTHGLNQSKPV